MKMKALGGLVSVVTGLTVADGAMAAAPSVTAAISHVDAAGAEKLLSEKKVVVLDIRTPAEFAAGHIAGAVNLDFNSSDFAKRLEQLDRSKTYLVHCASGNRSTRSLPQFEKLKFHRLVHLDGGLKAWTRAGKPVVK